MKHAVRRFEEVLAELVQARTSWGLLGHNLSVTRVGVYEREMQELVEMGPDGRSKLSKEQAGRVYLLLSETSEFLFISRVILDRPHLSGSPRIRAVFSGPDLAKGEKSGANVVSRNTLFELVIAAAIELAGLKADISGSADVRTLYEGTAIRVECKRPQSAKKVEANIRDAAHQLEEEAESTLGIIAVCIGKMLTDGERMLVAPSKEQMDARIDNTADAFIRDSKRFWEDKKAVSGLLVRINIPGVIESEQRPYHASLFFATNRPDLSDEKRKTLVAFIGHLERGLPGQKF